MIKIWYAILCSFGILGITGSLMCAYNISDSIRANGLTSPYTQIPIYERMQETIHEEDGHCDPGTEECTAPPMDYCCNDNEE